MLIFELDGRERVEIDDAGAVRYEVLAAPHPDHRDRAGVFAGTLDAAELRVAGDLARELAATDPAPRGRTGPVVTASVGDAGATHPLQDGGPAAVLLSAAIDRARPHPVSVVALTAELLDGTDVRLSLASVGTDPVTFQLDPAGLALRAEAAGQWSTVWQGPPARLALVAPPDGFLGGVTAPATLDAGRTALGLLPRVLTGPVPSRLLLTVAGTIALPGRAADEEDDDPFADPAAPTTAFRLSAPVR